MLGALDRLLDGLLEDRELDAEGEAVGNGALGDDVLGFGVGVVTGKVAVRLWTAV